MHGTAYPGKQEGIISQELWAKVHNILGDSPRRRAARTRSQTPALLKGLIFGPTDCAMPPTHTRKGGRLYRYYVSQSVIKHGPSGCPVGRVPAAEIETAVVDQLRGLLPGGITVTLISRPKLILECSGATTERRPTRMPLMTEPDPRPHEGDGLDVPIEQHPPKNHRGSKRGH